MISTSGRNSGLSRLIFVAGVRVMSTSRSACVAGLVTCSTVLSSMGGSEAASTDGSTGFDVLVIGGPSGLCASSTAEPSATGAGCVVVLWGGSKALLALMMAAKPQLEERREDEEEAGELLADGS